MRILKSLFFLGIGIGILAGIVFLIARELLLIVAVSQVRSSINLLRRTAANTGAYTQECRQRGATVEETLSIAAVQLRFDTPTSYVLEVVCNQFALDQIVVERQKLPAFAGKTVGSSGLEWGEELSGIGIEVFGRSLGIFVEHGKIWYGPVDKTLGLPGPLTTCAGHGFKCCQTEISQGVGLVMTEVTDCSQNCFQRCELRPLVLSLSTQPFYEQATRVLTIQSGQPIEVGFVIDPQGAQELKVKLDFGDGTIDRFEEFEGRTSHIYTCAQARCEYEITLQAFNEQDIESVLTSISKVKVVVTR
jgi:hypothetical protein